MAGTGEDVPMRMKKNVLKRLGYVEQISDEGMAKKIYEGEVSGKGRRQLISRILEEGHIKSKRTPRRACMKRLIKVDEKKEICRNRSVWHSVLSDYPAKDTA